MKKKTIYKSFKQILLNDNIALQDALRNDNAIS